MSKSKSLNGLACICTALAALFAAANMAKAQAQVILTVTSDGDPSSLPQGVSDTLTVVDANGNNVLPPLTVMETQEPGFFKNIPRVQLAKSWYPRSD